VVLYTQDVTRDGSAPLATPDAELRQLRQEVDLLRAEREQFLEQLQQKSREIDRLQHQVQQLLRRLYGCSAERIDPNQLQLFETLLSQLAPPTSEASPESALAGR
jgi:chromosome segregation ATPase